MKDNSRGPRQYSSIGVWMTVVGVLILGCFAGVLLMMHKANEDSHQAQMFAYMTEYKISFRGKLDSDIETLGMMAEMVRYNEQVNIDIFLDGLVGVEEDLLFDRIGYYPVDGTVSRAILSQGVEELRFEELGKELQEAVKIAWTGEDSVSQIYYDETLGRMTLTYAVPVRDLTGNVVGALAGSRSLKTFAEMLHEPTMAGTTMNIDLIGEDGTIYTWSRYSLIHQRMENILDAENLSEATRETILSQLGRGEQFTVRYPLEEKTLPLYVLPLEVNGWSLVFLDDQNDTVTPVYNMLAASLIILIFLLALCVGVLFFTQSALRRTNLAFQRSTQYDKTGALRLEPFLSQAERQSGDGSQWCMAVLTLPRYEELCATFGHQAGEAVAKRTAGLIQQSLVGKELFCHVKDCEFCLLLTYARIDLLRTRLEGILEQLKNVDSPGKVRYPLEYTAGVASGDSVSERKNTAEAWYQCAGMALKKTDLSRGRQIEFFNTEMYEEYAFQREVEQRSLEAVERDEFELYFLPKIDLKTGKLCGANAQFRWVLGDGRSLEPDQYRPLFEAGDCCSRLDLYLFEKLCAAMREWLDQGLEPLPVTIRQTPQLFYRTDYANDLEQIAGKYGVPAELLGIDIPIDVNQREIEASYGTFSALNQKGFLLSLDDYTTALHLLEMDSVQRISEVKIRSDLYVHCPEEYSQARENIVRNVVDAASELGVRVVAVGFEDAKAVYRAEPENPQNFALRLLRKGKVQ